MWLLFKWHLTLGVSVFGTLRLLPDRQAREARRYESPKQRIHEHPGGYEGYEEASPSHRAAGGDLALEGRGVRGGNDGGCRGAANGRHKPEFE